MAWGIPGGDSGGEISKFNPAQHKMNRINNISEIINECKLNLEAWNYQFNDWNFNIYLKSLNILYKEVKPKFSDNEKKHCELIKDSIEMAMIEFPISQRSRNKWTRIDEFRLSIFKKHIEIYEDVIRSYQDAHGLDTPNMEDDTGL